MRRLMVQHRGLLIGAALLALAVSGAWADTTSGGSYPYLGTARSLSMGGAFTAVADDEATLFWNPAGMALLQQSQAHLSLEANASDLDYLMGAYLWPNRGPQLGGGIAIVDASLGPRDDMVVQYSVGQWFNQTIAFGGTVKWQEADLVGSEDAFSFDLGLLYQNPRRPAWRFGLAVLDVSEPNFGVLGEQRRIVNAGAAWNFDEGTLLSLDLYDIGDHAHAFQVRLGGERKVTDNLMLRAGVAESDFGLGLGILYRDFTLDLGYRAVDDGDDLMVLSLHGVF